MQYEKVLEQIPHHLKQYIVDQHYERYTAQDHAVWRYIMRVNLDYLKDHAHSSYLDGLKKTGIGIEKIPNIDEMNEALQKIGWKAVIVDGFLPPAVFMEFQFRKILAISADMRTIQHLLYTPAPDIVHEAAGHAPIIADDEYSRFLQKFGEYGMKAFSSKIDIEIYEAIRHLSIIKEYPETTKEEIDLAEKDLNNKLAQNTNPSEMTLLSRLHWWTVEYGLIGDLSQQKIYGAGLLSSVGESKNCLKPAVKKIPISINCTNYNYDITNEQPQLFVNKDWQELLSVLEEFSNKMSFRTGGQDAIEKAIESEAVSTYQYSSGLQVSGVFSNLIKNEHGQPVYISTTGPTSLAFDNKQLENHGITYHADGFSSPVGKLLGKKSLENFSNQDLIDAGIYEGQNISLEFESGIKVQGNLQSNLRKENKLILLSFTECTVLTRDGDTLFDPQWGVYDMAIGDSIPSVFFGTADKINHNIYPPKSENVAIPIKYSEKDKELHKLYEEIRKMRDEEQSNSERLKEISKLLDDNFSNEWLLRLEVLEILKKKKILPDLQSDINKTFALLSNESGEKRLLIENGLQILNG
ncbi:MAG: aromatic amino acid hydroxylase [Calditrichaeota bacterium]|nr:MAG: aromatic amino acid hydroxylase [Calditrichota bacterium]MBL1205652.1 aromatic amino acid hydroxylase [Calditrichota bacterium]NOG45480.1 aromatic amino acid hydroxylase [Calditrichota bacterium]